MNIMSKEKVSSDKNQTLKSNIFMYNVLYLCLEFGRNICIALFMCTHIFVS